MAKSRKDESSNLGCVRSKDNLAQPRRYSKHTKNEKRLIRKPRSIGGGGGARAFNEVCRVNDGKRGSGAAEELTEEGRDGRTRRAFSRPT